MADVDSISLRIGRDTVQIDIDIYRSLFDNSVVHRYKKYEDTLAKKSILFADLATLSRKADIPYALFFAPKAVVKKNVDRKNKELLQGVTKSTFSLNSRGSIELRDIELIVKDLLRKQGLLKTYKKVGDNKLLGCIRGSRLSVVGQADIVRGITSIDNSAMRSMSKKRTLDYLIYLLENQNVFVSQSSRFFMPQLIHDSTTFSGVCIRDRKFPFVFLNNKDELKSFEPEGRKIFTLTLLAVCVAKAKFSPISYNDQSKNLIVDNLYRVTEELLMPEGSVRRITITSLNDLKSESDLFSVTPSALLMRLQRFKLLDAPTIREYRSTLKDEFNKASPRKARTPKAVNGFKKYNGPAYSKAVLELVDNGRITKREARRVLMQNKESIGFLEEYRMNL